MKLYTDNFALLNHYKYHKIEEFDKLMLDFVVIVEFDQLRKDMN